MASLTTPHCSTAMVQEAHITLDRTPPGGISREDYTESQMSLYPGKYRYKHRYMLRLGSFYTKRHYCIALQLLQYVAAALQTAALCIQTNTNQGYKTGPPMFFKLIFRARIISDLLGRNTCLPSREKTGHRKQ